MAAGSLILECHIRHNPIAYSLTIRNTRRAHSLLEDDIAN